MKKPYFTFFHYENVPLISIGRKHIKYFILFLVLTVLCRLYINSLHIIIFIFISSGLYILNILDYANAINVFSKFIKLIYDILMLYTIAFATAIICFGIERNKFNLNFGCEIYFVFSLFIFVPILQHWDKRIVVSRNL